VQPLFFFLFIIQVTAFQSLPGSDAAAAGGLGLHGVSSDDLAGLDLQTQEALRASAAGALSVGRCCGAALLHRSDMSRCICLYVVWRAHHLFPDQLRVCEPEQASKRSTKL
jgi:hypothetical protein